VTTRYEYVNGLAQEIAPQVWKGLAGNGSFRINLDTDVDCYGAWEPHVPDKRDGYDKVRDAQAWVEYFVFNSLNQLAKMDLLSVPEKEEKMSGLGFRVAVLITKYASWRRSFKYMSKREIAQYYRDKLICLVSRHGFGAHGVQKFGGDVICSRCSGHLGKWMH